MNKSERQKLTFPVKFEQAASLHRDLAISTNHVKAPGHQWEPGGDLQVTTGGIVEVLVGILVAKYSHLIMSHQPDLI